MLIKLPDGLSLRPHPCPYSDDIITVYQMFVDQFMADGQAKILDPMAGIGRMHDLKRCQVWTNELEPEWAYHHPETLIGDARKLPFQNYFFNGIFFSPPYANRLADNYAPTGEQKKGRKSYRIDLDREMSEGSTNCLQWGNDYRQLSLEILAESWRVLAPDGYIGINVKGHYRKGKLVDVAGWYDSVLTNDMDMCYVWGIDLDQKGWTYGPTRDRDTEKVLFYKKV